MLLGVFTRSTGIAEVYFRSIITPGMYFFSSKTNAMKPLVIALLFFASCSPQQKISKVTGGYTDEGKVLSDKTLSTKFVTNHKKPKTKRHHPSKYYVKSKPFFGRQGINGQLQLYKY